MSFNQSRSDRSDAQFRKQGRSGSFNQQRNSSGPSHGRGGGPAPSPSSSSVPSNRSFKKSGNVQGGQSRPNAPAANSLDYANAVAQHNVQNGGGRGQPPSQGHSDASAASMVAKPIEAAAPQRGTRPAPKAPTSHSSSMAVDSSAPATPAKGDASKSFPFQFGSISPGFMNGMQIPARTSSAPPNLDEQKRDQARHDAQRAAPANQIPKQLPKKDSGPVNQSNTRDSQSAPKSKIDPQVFPSSPLNQTHKPSVLPMPMNTMPMPFPQPQVSVQFGGPNPQLQSQGVTGNSLQVPIPIPLTMGNAAQVQQSMFVQGLQHHPMQTQSLMHQGQGLGFTTQMGHPLPQLGNLAMGISSQFSPQQGGKYGSARKTTVKITDPKTHEELRLDKRADAYADGGTSGLRGHPNMAPQSQPIPSYPPTHTINYFPNSYNNNMYYHPPGSLPLTSGQVPPGSQAPRFSYPVNQAPQNVSFINPSATISQPGSKSGPTVHGHAVSLNSEHAPDASFSVQPKPFSSSTTAKAVDSLSVTSLSAIDKAGMQKSSMPSEAVSSHKVDTHSRSSIQQGSVGTDTLGSKTSPGSAKDLPSSSVAFVAANPLSTASVHIKEPAPALTSAESRRKENLSSNSIKDNQKKLVKKGYTQHQHEVEESTSSVSSAAALVAADGSTVLNKEPIVDLKEAPISCVGGGPSAVLLEASGTGDIVNIPNVAKLQDSSSLLKSETPAAAEEIEKESKNIANSEDNSSVLPSAPTSKHTDPVKKTQEESVLATDSGKEVPSVGNVRKEQDEPVTCQPEIKRTADEMDVTSSSSVGPSDSMKLDGDETLGCVTKTNIVGDEVISVATSSLADQLATVCTLDSASGLKQEGEDNTDGGVLPYAQSGSVDKSYELSKSKSNAGRVGKKKRKEILQKADAAGTTADLYMAYKGPEDTKETVSSTETTTGLADTCSLKEQTSVDVGSGPSDKGASNKHEPEDWEDAADISTPKLDNINDENIHLDKKYSRDFLLKFSEQCTDLPQGFEITTDIADVLMSSNVAHLVDRESYPSGGRSVDRSNSGSRMDRRGGNMMEEGRWNKQQGHFGSGRDLQVDIGYAANMGFRPAQAGNFGVLRNPRPQGGPMQYAGGILSGPMQSVGAQGMPRNSPDADRWQRATNFQKGLIPSPQTPLQVMHKAERKYEVGKVTDEEQAKQRQLKAILNKLTPQNFEKLFEQVKAVNIDNAVTLTGVISQIFDKALMEPTFCEMYANFCYHLAGDLPDFTEDNEKITFKRLLLNKCQEEFERGEREQEEADKADEEGETKLSPEAREEKRVNARRRMLGNIRLIGELYKKKMLTERIMHECIKKLLGQYQNPDEEDVEALCKLMSTIGVMIDHPKAKEHMDAYFDRMTKLSNNPKLSSRVRFMLKDAIDLRRNKWQQRRKVEGPKKIDEVHRDAAQERHHQGGRGSRNPTTPARRGTMDFGHRGSSMLPSPNSHMGGFHGFPNVRGHPSQDIRYNDDRQSYEARTLSVPLPQRTLGEESITLGPQGGLARGMSIRGGHAIAATPVTDVAAAAGDSRRGGPGLNGFSGVTERPGFGGSREDLAPRYVSDRINNTPTHVRDGHATSIPSQSQPPAASQSVPSENVLPEERLRDMSIAAIKEYYSARDEKEVALCIKDMNSPGFHPSMISLWVTDSFERKDMERDLLAKLIVSLAKPHDAAVTAGQLVQGFEEVLSTLEDAVNDAPRAAEFLGRIFGRVVIENLVQLKQFGELLQAAGGDEPGQLLEAGLAGDVLGSTLEIIKAEKGETGLNEVQSGSGLRLEDFIPPKPSRSKILERFI
ncbi:Eukaryotic translation initiation factor 4G [Linum grandiflorum]